jgi:transcriptional regulator with XRE-family HTH domain
MNATELAQVLDVSLATVSRISSGDRRPSIDLIMKIRNVLGWSLESQAHALAESTDAYGNEFRIRMERRRIPKRRRCGSCERPTKYCACEQPSTA